MKTSEIKDGSIIAGIGVLAFLGYKWVTSQAKPLSLLGEGVHALFGGGVGKTLGTVYWGTPVTNVPVKQGPNDLTVYNAPIKDGVVDLTNWDARFATGVGTNATAYGSGVTIDTSGVTVVWPWQEPIPKIATVNVAETDKSFSRLGLTTAQVEWMQMNYPKDINRIIVNLVSGTPSAADQAILAKVGWTGTTIQETGTNITSQTAPYSLPINATELGFLDPNHYYAR